MWVVDLLIVAVAILSFLQIGLVFDFYVIHRRELHFNLAIFWGLGLGVVAIGQMVLGLLAIGVGRNLVLVTTIVCLLPLLGDRQLKVQLLNFANQSLKKIKPRDITFVLPFLIFIVVVAMMTFSHPVWGYDAIEHWLAKARAFYIDGGISRQNLFVYSPSDNPTLWPLAASWLFNFLGRSSDFWVQVIPLTTLVCLTFEFWRRSAGKVAIFWVGLLAFSPFLWQTVAWPSYSGNADLLVSFLLFMAFASLFGRQFVYTAIFLNLAALTKNDALPAILGFCILAPFFGLKNNSKSTPLVFVIALGLLLFNLGWKFYYGLSSRYLENDIGLVFKQRPFWEYTRYSLQAFREEFRQIAHWGIGFWIIGFFVITRFAKIYQRKELLLSAILLGLQFVGYIWVYYVTREDQASQIATSIYRLVLQVYPSLLLLAYVAAHESGLAGRVGKDGD